MAFVINYYITLSILICIFTPFSYAKCGREMSEFFQCFKDQLYTTTVSGPYSRGIEFDEFQRKISSCFTKNKCKDIKLETRKQIAKRAGILDDTIDDTWKLKECKNYVRQNLMHEVEQCVQRKIDTDFHLEQLKQSDYIDDPVDDVILYDMYMRAIILKLQNKADPACPSEDKIRLVVVCISDLFDRLAADRKQTCVNPFEEVTSRTFQQAKLCSGLNCFSKIGRCQETFDTFNQIVCACQANTTDTSRTQMESLLNTCTNQQMQNGTISRLYNQITSQVQENVCFMKPEDTCKNH